MMKKSILMMIVGLSALVCFPVNADNIAVAVKQDLLASCPQVWEELDVRILTSQYPTDVWQANTIDKEAFKTFMQTKMGVNAPDAAGLEAMANDILTVAAECAVQRVRFLDALLTEIPKDVLASMDSISAVLGAVGATTGGPDFESAEIAVVNQGSSIIAHGLGQIPSSVQTYLRCTTPDKGFSVGDEVAVASLDRTAFVVSADATNIFVGQGNDGTQMFNFPSKTGGSSWWITNPASWKIIVRAWK